MAATGRSDQERVTVAIVAAYPTVRAGLHALLAGEDRLEVVAEAASLRDYLAEPGPGAAVLVLDLDLDSAQGGLDALQALPPEAGLVILGPASGDARLIEAMGERPWGYLLKEATGAELARAIEAVGGGLVAVQPPLARRLFAPLRDLSPSPFPAAEGESAISPIMEPLTAREHEVLQLVAEGLPNKLIALKLGISEHTVKFHVTSILAKLDASSRTEAVRLGARHGLVVL